MSEIIEIKSSLEIDVESHFKEFEDKAKEWQLKASTIKVTDASQVGIMKEAREMRLAFRQIRIGVDKKHKDLKEEALQECRLLDSIKRRLNGLIEPLEEQMQKEEDFIKIQQEKAKAELFQKRLEVAIPIIGEQARSMQLGDLDEEVFNNMLKGFEAAKKEREAAAEAERLAKEEERRKQAEEQARIRAENEKLKLEAAAKEKERQAENARIAAEQKKVNDKLAKERTERKRLEDEAKAKQEAEEKERQEKISAERRAKRAPDKIKILALADKIESIEIMKVSSEEGQKVMDDGKSLLAKVVKFLRDKSETL